MKTLLTATAFALFASHGFAATASPEEFLMIEEIPAATEQTFETAAYCEWITIYDYWGNWMTLYECY